MYFLYFCVLFFWWDILQYIFGHLNIRDDSICWKIFVLELTNFFHTQKFFVGVWEIGDCAV